MDREKILDKTKKALRSLLISAPRGVAIHLLAKDYNMVMGKELPYRELGYRSLDDFISSIPDTIRIGNGPGGLTCYAVANAETQQIARFVALSKKPALKKSMRPPSIIGKPTKVSGFSKRNNFGPAYSRPKKFGGRGGGGAWSNSASRQYLPAGYKGGGGGGWGGGSKFGKPFHTKQPSAPTTNLPPRMRSSFSSENTSTYGGSTHMARPSSTSSLPAYVSKSSTTATKYSSPIKPAYSPVRYPGQLPATSVHIHNVKAPLLKAPPSSAQMKASPSQSRALATNKGIYPWRRELEKAESVSITRLYTSEINRLVCTTGYIASKSIKDESKSELSIKRLLYTDYIRGGKGDSVLLLFKAPQNVKTQEFSSIICDMAEGTKLKVFGEGFVSVNKKKSFKREPGIAVHYYEKVEGSQANGRSRTPSSHGSPSSARSISPSPSTKPASQMSSSNRQSLEKEIIQVLRQRPNGVYGRRLGMEYKKDIGKEAPADIFEFAKRLAFVQSEEIIEDNPILTLIESKVPNFTEPAKEPATFTISMATKRAESAPTTPISTSVKFVTEKPQLPSTVELGKPGDVLNVQVVHIDNICSFYVQKVEEGFSDKFQLMERQMSAHFSKNAVAPLTPISEYQLYGMHWNEDYDGGEEIWCRVLIRSIQKSSNKVYVLCPDFGNSLLVSTNELKDLPRQFYDLPFQAVHCCLAGLRNLENDDEEKAYKAFDDRAMNKTCIAQVMDSSGTRASVELIDVDSDGKETINSLLLQELYSEALLAPTLPMPGAEKVPVRFTDIDVEGIVTLQLLGPGLNQLDHLMNIINEAYEKPRAADFINKVEVGMVCCAIFSSDHKWYRAVVKEITPAKKYIVEFVDYGNEEEVGISKLRKRVDHHLFSLPFQAVKCTLHDLPPPEGRWTEAAIDAAMQYLDYDDTYLQVVEPGNGSRLPRVKLLIRCEGDEGEEDQSDIVDLKDILLSSDHLFGQGQSQSESSDIERAVQIPLPPSSSSPLLASPSQERPSSAADSVSSGSSSFASAMSAITDGMKDVKVSGTDEGEGERIQSPSAVGEMKHGGSSDMVQSLSGVGEGKYEQGTCEAAQSSSAVSKEVEENGVSSTFSEAIVQPSTTLSSICMSTATAVEGSALNRINISSSENTTGTNGEAVEVNVISEEPFKMEDSFDGHEPFTPPSSIDNISIFSPHTPSDSPAHSSSKLVPYSESSDSFASLGVLSPRCQSPVMGEAPAQFLVGGATVATSNGLGGTDKFKYSLNFASLELKSTVPVIVSCATSPNKFTVQLVANLDELDSMSNSLGGAMLAVDQDPSNFCLPVDSILPGMVCCAFSDGLWFRVLVLEPPVLTSATSYDVKVEFLDYGGTENVSCLRQLPKSYLELPFQGISSSLHNIVASNDGWSSEALEYFESLVLNKQLYAVVHSKDLVTTSVFLLDTMSVPETTLNLGQELIVRGFAKNI